MGFPCGSAGKESTCSVGDLGSIPGLGRSPGEEKGYPLQYSGLENCMDCIVHGVTKSRTRLSGFHFLSVHVVCFAFISQTDQSFLFGMFRLLICNIYNHLHDWLSLKLSSCYLFSICAISICSLFFLFFVFFWSEVAQSCPTLRDPMDCSLPGSSVHGIFQARVLEWGAIAFCKGSSRPRDQIPGSSAL